MSKPKTKLTGVERTSYADYLESMKQSNIIPRSPEDWVALYRTTQARIRNEETASAEDSK